MRILLVEDDNMIGQSLRQALTENGLAVDWVRDGVLAQDALSQGVYAAEEVSSNAVEVLIHGVRRKLGADVIRNVRGLGWRVSKDPT